MHWVVLAAVRYEAPVVEHVSGTEHNEIGALDGL